MSRKAPSQTPQPRLIVVSAPSGGGKTTLCKMLLDEFPNISLSISTTTRPPRAHEINGKHYHFVSPEEFQAKIDAGVFAEWAHVHGNLYGTSIEAVDKALAENKHILFDIDYQGALSLTEIYKDRVLSIFIMPPSMQELKDRLLARKTESAESIATRLDNAYNELQWSQSFQYQITNDNLTRAYQEMKAIIEKECR